MDMFHENLQQTTQKKSGVSPWTLVIVIIVTFLVAFFLVKNLGTIGNRISWGASETGAHLAVGQSVSLTGEIVQNGDYITYTHTITTTDYGVVGIKSKTIDLNQYSGIVLVQWVVEKKQNDLFIVEVTSASGAASMGTWTISNVMTQEGTYITAAGVYLPYAFGNAYSLDGYTSNEIKVKNLTTNQNIVIEYFACKAGDPNKDCAQLVKNFASSSDNAFTNANGDKFYKSAESNSWFMTNSNFYGYYINNAPDQEARDLANAIIIVNKEYAEKTLLPKVISLCTDGNSAMQSATAHTLWIDMNGLFLQIQWPTANGPAQCKIILDPSSSLGGQKLSFSVTPAPSITGTSSSTSSSSTPSSLDFSVKQFPINMAKALTYTSSSKWYSIVLPSSNISYAGVTLNEDFDISGLRCSSQMNVIKFSDKALLSTNPTIKIFECTAKKDITLPSNAFLQTKLSDGRIFLIEIMDGAWKDFASNITIQ